MRVLGAAVMLLAAACGPGSPPGGTGHASSTTGAASTAGAVSVPVPASPAVPAAEAPLPARPRPVRITLVGDIMLGRGVAPVVRSDPEGIFAEVRTMLDRADIAAGNLESPLTTRPHIAPNPFALEADPASARLLSAAGFDVMGIANNHSGDAGRPSIVDTMSSVADAGMRWVGAGTSIDAAYAPLLVERGELTIAFLAFDASRAGTLATDDAPGVAHWIPEQVRPAVEAARRAGDVVVVGVHGGVEYYRDTDPGLAALAKDLAAWGADVVWGHGPHVVQPVYTLTADDGRRVVVATSLGNFLFDQNEPGTRTGAVLEVLAGPAGAVAYRVGLAGHEETRLHFEGWESPSGDAVLLGLEWWNLVSGEEPAPSRRPEAFDASFRGGVVTDAALGDVNGDGVEDLVVSYRYPPGRAPSSGEPPTGGAGSAHLGVYRPGSLESIWEYRGLLRPVAVVAACDASLALGFGSLDDPVIVATGGWVWAHHGFAFPLELPGGGTPGCLDVDGDGQRDPVVLNRR